MPENAAPEPGFTVNDPRVHNLIQGQQVQLHMNQPVQAQVHSFAEGPLLIGRIPRPAPGRIDRNAAIAAEGRTVLTGLPGAGKTQAAAEYARKRWSTGELDLLVWVDASTPDGIAAAFAEAAASVRGTGNADQFLTWIDRPNAPRWLIVLDGVSDADHLTDLWPPENSRGKTILTTQIRSAALDGHRINVGPFTPEESTAYLEKRIGAGPSALKGAKALAADLGHLPLALAHVAAHLLDRPGLDCTAYSQLFIRKADGSAAANRPPAVDSLRQAIIRADRHEPERFAKAIFCLASVLDPAGIPAGLFRAAVSRDAYRQVQGLPSDAAIPIRVVQEALASLHRLSLIDLDGEVVRIHPLALRAGGTLRNRDGGLEAWANVANAALRSVRPGANPDPVALAIFQANAERVRAIPKPPPKPAAQPAAEPKAAAKPAAEPEAAPHPAKTTDRPETPATRDTPAARPSTTAPAAATAAHEKFLADCLRRVGPDDVQTFAARSNLARHRGDVLGDYVGAVAALELLLADAIRVFGPSALVTDVFRTELDEYRRKAR
jgi:hypothetical protein